MQTWLCRKVWENLKQIDYEFTKRVKKKGCPHCKGVLDWANFPRKPRGFDDLHEDIRFSLCCRDCRKRVTTDSVRFLWKKVYVLLAVALEPIWKPIGVCGRTLFRWRQFWSEQLSCNSPFCFTNRYRLPIDFSFTLDSLVTCFEKNNSFRFIEMAQLLSPLGCALWLRYQNFHAEDAS